MEEPRTRAWPQGAPRPDPKPGTVAAVMSRDLVTVDVGVSLEQALTRMEAAGIHHLLLTDRGAIVAIASDRNLVRGLGLSRPRRDDERYRRHPVFQVASYRLYTVPEEARVEDAAALLLAHDISALPVVDAEDRITGILTSRDLLQYLADRRADAPADGGTGPERFTELRPAC